jgi:hypothetical protein
MAREKIKVGQAARSLFHLIMEREQGEGIKGYFLLLSES